MPRKKRCRGQGYRGGIYRGSRKQRGGLLPLIPAGIIAGLKAAAIASGIGAASAIGNEVVGSISRKIRGGSKRHRRFFRNRLRKPH